MVQDLRWGINASELAFLGIMRGMGNAFEDLRAGNRQPSWEEILQERREAMEEFDEMVRRVLWQLSEAVDGNTDPHIGAWPRDMAWSMGCNSRMGPNPRHNAVIEVRLDSKSGPGGVVDCFSVRRRWNMPSYFYDRRWHTPAVYTPDKRSDDLSEQGLVAAIAESIRCREHLSR